MARSYAILIEYSREYTRGGPAKQTIYLDANSAELIRMLGLLNASPAVLSLGVTYTLTLPALHKFTKLAHADLGIEPSAFEKLK
jgi:hypothetical protein